MRVSVRSNLCSAMLVFALMLDSRPVVCQIRDPYEGRLFLIKQRKEDLAGRNGFSATCGGSSEVQGEKKWFAGSTDEEIKELGEPYVLFSHEVRDMVETQKIRCFSTSGDFPSCQLAKKMNDEVHDGWSTCEIGEFFDLDNTEPSLVNDIRAYLADQSAPLISHIEKYVVSYFVGSMATLAVGVVAIAVACYKTRQANLRMWQAKIDEP